MSQAERARSHMRAVPKRWPSMRKSTAYSNNVGVSCASMALDPRGGFAGVEMLASVCSLPPATLLLPMVSAFMTGQRDQRWMLHPGFLQPAQCRAIGRRCWEQGPAR